MRTIKNGKRVIGILFGIMALIEGLFAIYIAKPTSIASLGGIGQTTFVLAGAQLVAIGAVMVLVWALYKNKRMDGTKGKVISILMLVASVIMVVEGIATAYLSCDVLFNNDHGISKKYIALVGAQLFMIGLIQLSLWIRRDRAQRNWLFEGGAMVLTILLMGEALLVMGISTDTTINGIGTVAKGTIFLAGVQLFLISGVLLALQLFREKSIFANRLGKGRMNLLFSLLALAIAFEGLVMAYYSGPVIIKYSNSFSDGFGKLAISLVAAQLFAIGLLVFSFWRLAEEKLDRKAVIEFLGMGSGIVLATEGALVLGIAGNIQISNQLGGITTRTVMMAGLGMVLLGLIVLFSWHFKNNRIVKRIAGKEGIDILMFVVCLIIGLGGVVLSAFSANIKIEDIGGISAKYVELAGIQLILLASIMVLMWSLRFNEITLRMKRMSYMVALFMLLLIPPAILM